MPSNALLITVSVPDGWADPWEKNIFAPPNSVIRVTCTVERSDIAEMHFMLPGESNRFRHFRADVDVTFLNNNGFYELPLVQSGTTRTLRVMINGTDSVKNGTVIWCQAVHAGQ